MNWYKQNAKVESNHVKRKSQIREAELSVAILKFVNANPQLHETQLCKDVAIAHDLWQLSLLQVAKTSLMEGE